MKVDEEYETYKPTPKILGTGMSHHSSQTLRLYYCRLLL